MADKKFSEFAVGNTGEELELVGLQGGQNVRVSVPPGGVGTGSPFEYGQWVFDGTSQTPPTSNTQIRFNNVDPNLATECYIDDLDVLNNDRSLLINGIMGQGDTLFFQQRDDANIYTEATIVSVTDNAGYTTVEFTVTDFAGAWVSGQQFKVISSPSAESYEVQALFNVEYSNTSSPVAGTIYDTGIDPATLPQNSLLTYALIYTSGGETWASYNYIHTTRIQAIPDIWLSGQTEPGAGTGDASVYFRYGSVSGNLEIQYQFDGAGKVATELRVISETDKVVRAGTV